MSESIKNSELPDAWEAVEYVITGRFKLYAVFKHQDSEKEVHVVPYKTYELPGFTSSHRVTVESPENKLEVVAEGLEVKNVDKAKQVAKETMRSV